MGEVEKGEEGKRQRKGGRGGREKKVKETEVTPRGGVTGEEASGKGDRCQ